jgi:hypothetical protein
MIHRFRQSGKRKTVSSLVLGGAVLIVAGLSQTALSSERNVAAQEKFERVLMLPAVSMTEFYGENATLRGPLSGEVFITDRVLPRSIDFLEATFRNRLMQLDNVRLVPAEGVVVSELPHSPVQGTRLEKIAAIRQAGRQSGADAVLCSYVYVFRERVGESYGADAPARISFESVLVSVATGRLIWQGSYSEIQKPLTDNLLGINKFIQRRGRWITGKEMMAQAIDEMIESISALRTESQS